MQSSFSCQDSSHFLRESNLAGTGFYRTTLIFPACNDFVPAVIL